MKDQQQILWLSNLTPRAVHCTAFVAESSKGRIVFPKLFWKCRPLNWEWKYLLCVKDKLPTIPTYENNRFQKRLTTFLSDN